jgi:predicted O-linked N-acetylglucosamine transferase (SPINDLY family)/glycosyltransferase involved in cell wall biosynthesis
VTTIPGEIVSASKPLVSIVWYGKNRMQSVEREVDGLLRQTSIEVQLVVQDGGSTDGTLEWFRHRAEHDNRIDVASADTPGPGGALLDALRRCTGDYIAICPRQASLIPETLEFAVQELEQSPDAGAMACRGLLVDAGREPAPVAFDLVMALFTPLRIAPSGGVIRRAALIESGLMRNDWRQGCDVLDLWCRLAMDHDVSVTDRTIVDGKAGREADDFAFDAHDVVEDRLSYVEALFGADNFFADARDPALQYECMANQLAILGEELRAADVRAVDRRSHNLARKFFSLRYDKRATRSLRRWRRMWRLSGPLEALAQRLCGAASSVSAATVVLGLGIVFQPVFRALLRARSRKQEPGDLPVLFADLYAKQAERYTAHGQLVMAMRNWRLAEALGDAMKDSMALQTELKRPGVTEASLAETHKQWVARHVTRVSEGELPDVPRWDGKRRIRIGYHCAFMHLDTIRYMMGRVLQAHDRGRFEIHAYSPFPLPPDIAQGFDVIRDTSATRDDPGAVSFHDEFMISHDAFRRLVRTDGIDVLVELTGFSPGHRFQAMADRCAPVQVSFLNHTASSQVPNVDYIIADEICLPEAAGFQVHYSEAIYRLPVCFFCFDYRGSAYPPIAKPPSLTRGYVTFGCFGFGGKLNSDLLRLWADLLHAIPSARLHIQNVQIANERSRRFLVERFRRLGIGPDRLTLAVGVDRRALLDVFAEIDIKLDNWPYCGGNSTAEALWHGVPVITLTGDCFGSRYGASLLAAAGCADLAAESPEQYIAVAQRLAGDPARLTDLRQRLRDMSIEHGLGDSVGFARRLEDAYVDMLSRVGSDGVTAGRAGRRERVHD